MHQFNLSLSFSHAYSHSLPSSVFTAAWLSAWCHGHWGQAAASPPDPRVGEGRGMKPKGCIWLYIAWDCQGGTTMLRTEKVSGLSWCTRMYLSIQHASKKKETKTNPKQKRERRKTVLVCNCNAPLHGPVLESDTQDCNMVTERPLHWRWCAVQSAALSRDREKPSLWGSTEPKTQDCPLHSAQTLRNVGSFPQSPRDPLESSQEPNIPPWTMSFPGTNLCKKRQRGILSRDFTFSISPQYL